MFSCIFPSVSVFPSGLNEVRKIVLRGLLLQTPTLQEYPLLLTGKHLFWKAVNRMRETQETAPIPNSGLVLGIPLVMRWTKMSLRLWLLGWSLCHLVHIKMLCWLPKHTSVYVYNICNIIYIYIVIPKKVDRKATDHQFSGIWLFSLFGSCFF